VPLYWAVSCIEYQITVDDALVEAGKMTSPRALEIVHRVAVDWSGAKCKGSDGVTRSATIRLVDKAVESCPAASQDPDAGPKLIHFSAVQPDGGDGRLAVTDVTYEKATGRITKADTTFLNVYDELEPGSPDQNIRYVLRHELGHFLGLAHSQHTDAVMYAFSPRLSTDVLSPDDIQAVCDAYNPEAPIGAGCNVERSEPTAAETDWTWRTLLWTLAIGALFALRWSRKAGTGDHR
jgi:hypothetical protein